jgi:hypothetical protein
MKLENGKLVLERRACLNCNEGTIPGQRWCPTCKGTGKGKRGGAGGCRTCRGMKTTADFDNPTPCPVCKGNYQNAQPETTSDYLPDDIWRGLTFKVYRTNQPLTWNESHLGLGFVFSCEDYGRAWNDTDENIITSVKEHGGHQASKIAKDDGSICDHVAIVVKRGGYAVKAVFTKPSQVEA